MANTKNTELTESELRRYARQLLVTQIQLEGQQKLKSSKILLIGVGGMGTAVLQYLAAAGVGTIGICDYASVNESQFHRQIMFGIGDLGKLKTIVAKEKLLLLNPYVNYQIHNIKINQENIDRILLDYQLIIDTTNDLDTNHLLINYLINKEIPLIVGNAEGFYGEVLIGFKPSLQLQNYLQYNKTNEKGLLGAVCGMVGTIIASQTLNYLVTHEKSENKYFSFNAIDLNFECKIC